jgi:hypothetical protein
MSSEIHLSHLSKRLVDNPALVYLQQALKQGSGCHGVHISDLSEAERLHDTLDR